MTLLESRRLLRQDPARAVARAMATTTPENDMKRLGVDVGGTFTDLIYVDDESGRTEIFKLPTTPDDPSRGTVDGIAS